MTESGPTFGARPRAVAAGVVAGLALWCTRGGLELVAGPDGPLRVAVLPSGWQALSLVAAMAGLALGLAHAVAWRVTGNARALTDADADVVRPLVAAGVLVLPYLPYLPDWWPALTVLAGRFALVVWLVVAALTLRAAWLRVRDARRAAVPVAARRLPAAPVVVFLAGLAIYGGVAWRFAGTGLFPGGDEPHYLVLAQSLWRDHDFAIENNHARGDTFEYFRPPLEPHYLVRGKDGQIYSIHPVGLAIVAAPIYAAGGYPGVVAFLVLCAAAAAAGAWVAARRLTGSTRAATLAWVGAAASAPFVFNSGTVYPEIPAAACAMAAYLLATRAGGLTGRPGLAAWCGLALAALPWLSSKYALMMTAIGLLALGRMWLPIEPAAARASSGAGPPRLLDRARIAPALAMGLPMVVSVALWLAFFQWLWGSPLPSVVYGTQRPVRWEYFVKGGPGLLFDQEYGIVPAAPVFAAALVGLAVMLASDARARRVAIEVAAIFVALLVPVGAFHLWSGGSGAIGRPVIAAILLLGLPIAWLAQRTAANAVAAASLVLLAVASLAQMLFLLVAQHGLLLVAGRDGVSRLLEYWSPFWRLWSLAPSFLMQAPAIAWAFTAVWLIAIAAAARAMGLIRRPLAPGAAGLAACGIAGTTLAAVSLVVPLALERHRAPDARLGVRAQSVLLTDFDAQRRPLGVVYDPLRHIPAADVPPLLAFLAGPKARGERSGVDLLYDARWALPAGRYEVQLQSGTGGLPFQGEIGLQIGRVGPPLRSWTIAPATARWSATIDLPANARFVGFKASPDLAQAGPELRLVPLAVPDLRTRRTDPDVVQARQYGDAAVFFFDERVSPEPGGFWTRGDSLSRFAVTLSPVQPTALRLRAGPRPVTVALRLDGGVERVTLAADATRDVPLRSRHSMASIEIATEGGFVPAEVDPAARDRRRLGVWVEVVR
jgi:hypothetical protein